MKYILRSILTYLLLTLTVNATETDTVDRYVDGQRAFTQGDYELAYDIWLPLAESGYVKAQSNVAHLYSTGSGVEKDTQKAIYWLEKAVKGGNLQAKYNLADHYRVGSTVNQDTAKAEMLFREAINGGFKYGIIGLLKMYKDGKIKAQNKDEEKHWDENMILLSDPLMRRELLWVSDERNY